MKTWGDVKKAVLDKLFMTEDEARQQNYSEKFMYLANECLTMIANNVKANVKSFEITTTAENQKVAFPSDFISYANLVNYRNNIADPEIIFVDYDTVILPEIGSYIIFYNANWETIVSETQELKIDKSVLMCLPSYIASQVLSQDDIQRSTILRNEFELFISRLDTTTMYQQNHYRSEGGWY